MVDENIKYANQEILKSGFPCPRCQNRITATIVQLLSGSVTCPTCTLKLEMDQKGSAETLEKLNNFQKKNPNMPQSDAAARPTHDISHNRENLSADRFATDNNMRLIYKDKSKLMRMFNFLFYLNKPDSLFMTLYATTGGNRTVYIPHRWWSKATEQEKIILLRHELVHIKQMGKYGRFLFLFLYLIFPLPAGLSYFRAKFEKEGYEETLRARYEYWGVDSISSDQCRNWIVSQFTGGVYGWMWPFSKSVNAWYDDTIRKIINSN